MVCTNWFHLAFLQKILCGSLLSSPSPLSKMLLVLATIKKLSKMASKQLHMYIATYVAIYLFNSFIDT